MKIQGSNIQKKIQGSGCTVLIHKLMTDGNCKIHHYTCNLLASYMNPSGANVVPLTEYSSVIGLWCTDRTTHTWDIQNTS
jgi:hypothetical protein